MSRILFRRLLHVLPVLLVVSLATMLLIDLAPGDTAVALLGEQATQEQIDVVRLAHGLDKPILTRYLDWVSGIVTGDLGNSLRTGLPVRDVIVQKLPVTLELAVLALFMALLISIPIGIFSAFRADGPFDRATQVGTSFTVANPNFVVAIFLIFVFAVKLRVFPVSGWVPLSQGLGKNLHVAFLPALTLALHEIGIFIRLLRSDMLATLQEDYIHAAKAKGLPSKVILVRHALRPSSFSLLTLAGLSFGSTIGGSVIVESIFGIPGLGNLLIRSIEVKDSPMVQGTVLFIALSYVLVNAFVDSAYRWLDPRVRSREV